MATDCDRIAAMLAAKVVAICLLAARPWAGKEVNVPPIWPQVQGVRGQPFTSGKFSARIRNSTQFAVKAVVSVKPDAEPGRHEMRLLAGHGSALVYFDVGTLPERNEQEPDGSVSQARRLVEAGVRFVSVGKSENTWDHHGNLLPAYANEFMPELIPSVIRKLGVNHDDEYVSNMGRPLKIAERTPAGFVGT